MTIAEAIQRVDTLRPNRYKDKEKVMWLSELDGQIFTEILMAHEGNLLPFRPYKYAQDKELFNAAYSTYSDYYTRTHMPVQHVVEFQL